MQEPPIILLGRNQVVSGYFSGISICNVTKPILIESLHFPLFSSIPSGYLT